MSGWQLYAIAIFMGLFAFLAWKVQIATSVEQFAWGLALIFIAIAVCAVISAYLPVS